MKVRRDGLGIPILNAAEIENVAQHFLEQLAPGVLKAPIFTPLGEIATTLKDRGLCTFSFDEDLGTTRSGDKYLGYFDIKRHHIAIDASLAHDDVRFPFTLAHELGHFYLHGKVKPEALESRGASIIRDAKREFLTHRIEGARPRTLLEWHANRFAAAVLLPRATARSALSGFQRARGITRKVGTVWLDRQSGNKRDFRMVLAQMSALYRVSRSVVRYRLGDLGLVHVEKGTVPELVGNDLGTLLQSLFAPTDRPT